MELYHPETDVNYQLVVDWRHEFIRGFHSYPNGDPGEPDEEYLDWNAVITHIDGQPVPVQTELPDWITAEMIEEQLDTGDITEPDFY